VALSAGATAIEVLLATGILVALLCCLAMPVMKSCYERLHFMAPVSTVSVTLVLIAVIVQEGWGQATIKTLLILLALVFTNAVLAHATARAARVREWGHWQPAERENIPGLEQIAGGRRKSK
jgi:monovalent cation/proton antiporter MnhG/PhaG subunit